MDKDDEDRREVTESGNETVPPGDLLSLLSVSKETHQLLTAVCTRSISNDAFKRLRSTYQLPRIVATKSPNLDAFLKPEVPANAKGLDKDLAKVQSFLLDTLAPITSMLEHTIRGIRGCDAARQILGCYTADFRSEFWLVTGCKLVSSRATI